MANVTTKSVITEIAFNREELQAIFWIAEKMSTLSRLQVRFANCEGDEEVYRDKRIDLEYALMIAVTNGDTTELLKRYREQQDDQIT